MKRITITPPTKKELIMLRVMVFLGCLAIIFFLSCVFDKSVRGYAPLYWMLMVTFLFISLKVLYEWYHYLHITVPETPPLSRTFTVDIFTTFCAGEPYEMILETLTAIKAINYPHETYLCDESDDLFLKKICLQLGVHHVTRSDKTDAKAGNINNALKLSNGEICVVLDPDHVPHPEFLDPILPHFNRPEIGYVQIVQAYKNGGESLIAKGAAQQTYQFYGPIMMTMNKYGTVQAIGANCTFRRDALASIGGHAAGLAEDLHTAMQLHAKGWKSVYVPEVVARGLVPSTLSAYYKQQLKWSRGVFDLLVTAYPKLFSSFSWRQKLHYGVIPMHYMSGIIYLINFLIPMIALCIGASPMHMDISVFGLVVFPFIASIVLVRQYVQRWVMEEEERGFHVVGGLLLIGTWWIFILGLVYTIAGKKVPYVPTPKDGNEANNWPLNVPNLIVLGMSAGAIGYGLLTDWNPYNLIMAMFAGLNCFTMCFTIVASRQQQFRHLQARLPWLNAVMIRVKFVKRHLWIYRHQLYVGLRNPTVLIFLFLLSLGIYSAKFDFLKMKPEIEKHTNHKILRKFTPESQVKGLSAPDEELANSDIPILNRASTPFLFRGTRGINYLKGSDWQNEYDAFTKNELVADFQEMKKIGINTVKFYGPSFYDHNILRVADQQGMNLHFGFWVPDNLDFRHDRKILDELFDEILSTVDRHKSNPRILSWNLGNDVYQNLSLYYQKSDLTYQQSAYLHWLKKLVTKMKSVDPKRPITLDILVSDRMNDVVDKIESLTTQISSYGLFYDDKSPKYLIPTNFPHFISYAAYDVYNELLNDSAGVFISNWQDVHTSERVSFDAIVDQNGRKKNSYLGLAHKWKGSYKPLDAPKVKILKPAVTTDAGTLLNYHAIIKKGGAWSFAKNTQTNFGFEWKLVQMDQLYNLVSTKDVGTGPSLTLRIPDYPETYKLYLFVLKGSTVIKIINSDLNTPLKLSKKSPALL